MMPLADDAAERWAKLPPEKRAFLEQRLRSAEGAGMAAARIAPRPVGSRAELSYAQERLWFLDQLEPGAITYNRPWAVRLAGRIDQPALETTLNTIVRRHEALRTVFAAVEGSPAQVVLAVEDRPLPVIDLTSFPEAAREAEAMRRAVEHARRPFNLACDVMLRPALIRLRPQDNVLLLTSHHIAFDGWSEGVLLRELAALYPAFLRGRPSPLPELPLQYADFAYWQRHWLQGETLESHTAFWRAALAGAPDVIELDADHPPPLVQTHRGARRTAQIDAQTLQSIKALGRRTETTLFMTLLAAFEAVLSFHTPHASLLVGCPIAGRNRLELEQMIGFFVDTLVVRADVGGDPTLIELIGRTRRAALEAMAHQDLPFATIVESLAPKRDLSHLPLVQVTFQLRNLPRVEGQLPGVSLAPFEFDAGLARFDLSLEVIEQAEGLTCHLTYNLDRFEEATARRFLSEFERLLPVLAAYPERRLSDLRSSLAVATAAAPATLSELEAGGALGDRSNLTRNQLRVWLGGEVWPGLPLYNIPFAFSIHRELDPQHFQRAFQALIDRSDALRTVVEIVQGMPQQRIQRHLPFEVLTLDLSNRPHPEQEALAWVQARCEEPLGVEERLFDCALLQCSASHWIWYLNLHHLIADLGSVRLIFQSVQDLYQASVEGRLQEAPGLPAFSEYVAFERRARLARSAPAAAAAARDSADRLDGLRFYGRRAPQRATRVDKITLGLGAERTRRLKALALEDGFFTKTPDASLLNLTATLLFAYVYRATESRSLVLGVPFYNRPEPFTKTVGLLMEFVPFRVTVEEGETFRSLAHKVTLNATEVLGRGVLEVGLASDGKGFEVSLNYLNAVFDRFLGGAVTTEYLSHGHDDDTLAVRLEDYEGSGSLIAGFLFRSGTFPAQQQARAVRHFEHLLEALLANPDACLDDVAMLTEEEKGLLRQRFSGTGATQWSHGSLVQAFEERVRTASGLTAVVDGQRSLSYERLNTGANQWARYLLGAGIRPGMPVGVCMERSIEWLTAFLAVLKSGGAYLPLDPSLPRERLRVMLEDAGASLVLTRPRWKDALPIRQVRLVFVDEERRAVARLPADNLEPQAGPDDPAYVIFTSGSSGRPKGVLVEHHSLLNLTSWAVREYGLHSGDRVLQFASIAWDTSLEETAPALASGATLVLRPEEALDSFAGFLKLSGDLGLTVLTLPTVLWHELAEAMAREQLPIPASVRLVVFGGERASQERLHAWRTSVRPGVRLVNTYGLTEAAAVAAWCDLTAEREDPTEEGVPVGRPISNVRAYVLDPHQRLTPIGVPGELYLAGEGLARGYAKPPEGSGDPFLQGPLEEVSERRLFRTGDLARFLPDGTLVCLGRTDLQVKVRGHRIEPEEIEGQLLKYPGVREVVVVAHPTSGGGEPGDFADSRLVAYIVSAPGQTPPRPDQLRDFLRASLPDFMFPSAYVMLEALPRTPSRKVDRHALPEPDWRTQERSSSFVAPRDELERQLAAVWEEVLGVRPIGLNDSFFDMGGHSLLAVRLFARIEKKMGRKLPVRTLFEAPTLGELAAVARSGSGPAATSTSLVALQADGSRDPLFWVHAAGGHVVAFRQLAAYLGPDQPSYALEGTDFPEGVAEPQVEEIAARYIRDILEVRPAGPYLLGGLSFGGLVAFEMARQLRAAGHSVPFLALFDTRRPPVSGSEGRQDWGHWALQRADYHLGNLSALDLRGKAAYLATRIQHQASRITPLARSTRDRLHVLVRWGPQSDVGRAYRAAHRARHAYRPQPYDGPITIFRAAIQPKGMDDPSLGWAELARGGLKTIVIGGRHVSIMAGSRLPELAKEIRHALPAVEGTLG